MTYALSLPLQEAVYQHLATDPALAAQLGDAIYDALPAGSLPQTYVTLGPEQAQDRSDRSGGGARHLIDLTIHSDIAGFAGAKAIAATICDILLAADLQLSRGRVVGLWFNRALAKRTTSGGRRITLRFVVRLEDTA
ncbi:DUF3168 domain-containing protein [Phaeobacter sp.]|uniref:DUF3168 domain-containing protein n=1 Tax=Phaeobacter sp. TaxID=1902409 RepID=UPI0025F262AC|nr:DUF3168 domain-containing protein [Phaeobacter sp.]